MGRRAISEAPRTLGECELPSKTEAPETGAALNEDAIRQRAYYLWEADGRPDGKGDHYWAVALEEAKAAARQPLPKLVKAKLVKPKAKAAPQDKPKSKVKAKAEAKPTKKAASKPRAATITAKKPK